MHTEKESGEHDSLLRETKGRLLEVSDSKQPLFNKKVHNAAATHCDCKSSLAAEKEAQVFLLVLFLR